MKSFIEFTKLEDRDICNYFVKDLKLKTKKDWEAVLKDFSKEIFKMSIFSATLKSKKQIDKFLNEVLKISSPENDIKVSELTYSIESSKRISIEFYLNWELESGIFSGGDRDRCRWVIVYDSTAILDFRINQYFDNNIILYPIDFPDKGESEDFWYMIGDKHNTFYEIIESSREYYKNIFSGFLEFVQNLHSGGLDKYIQEWKVEEFVGLKNFFAASSVMAKTYGWLVGSGITKDFSFVIGSWVYDFYYRNQESIISVLKEDLLSDPGYPTIAMEKAWVKLNDFKKKYIDSDGEYQSFVKIVSEAQERIKEFTRKVSEETGIHPDFLSGLWKIKDVPEDISESVEYNKEKRLKKIN